MKGLLRKDVEKRFGISEDLLAHAYFADVDRSLLYQRRLPPPLGTEGHRSPGLCRLVGGALAVRRLVERMETPLEARGVTSVRCSEKAPPQEPARPRAARPRVEAARAAAAAPSS